MIRVACYARFSSDLQRETSLDDQLAIARRYAEAHGWAVLPDHIYTDAALSGVSLERAGIQALLAAAEHRPRPFDVLLVDDSSRVARDIADALRFMQQLRFLGVRVLYLSQGIDSASPQADTLIAVHGIVDNLYLRELAAKVKRGLAGQIDRGFSTGGLTPYGYRTFPVPDPSGKVDVNGYAVLLGKRVEIVPEEARVVLQIFEWYADGYGVGRIVERLRQEGLHRRGHPWLAGAVKGVLAKEKYTGKLMWGRVTFERRPGTRQVVQRGVPRSEWRVVERPDLRIVSDELWQRVQTRRRTVRETYGPSQTLMRGRNAMLYSRHLFSGFMRCGLCSGAVTVVSGGYGSSRYGCQPAWKSGAAVCTNRLTMRAKIADRALLDALRAELLAPTIVNAISTMLAAALNAKADSRTTHLADALRQRTLTAERLQRLIDAVEQGVSPASLANAIAQRQAELAQLDAAIADLQKPLPRRLAIMPAWVRQQLEDLAGLLQGAPERAKAEFQQLNLKIVMTPVVEPGARPFYRAAVESGLPALDGQVDFSPSGRSDLR